jgi:hypothetical protein
MELLVVCDSSINASPSVSKGMAPKKKTPMAKNMIKICGVFLFAVIANANNEINIVATEMHITNI